MTILRTLSVVVGALFGASLFVGPAAAVEKNVFGSWVPAADYLNRVTLPKAFAGIAKDTNGKINWKLVPGGQLAGPKETFQAVRDGLMQGGLGIATYVPNVVPSLNAIYSTVVFSDDVVAATGAALETLTLHCPSCLEEFRRINAIPLAGWTSSPYFLACREPVRTLSDLKGKRVRITGGASDLMRMLGAVPVAATLVEAVSLLQRGGIDCEFGVHSWLKVFGYADFAKYVTDTPLGLTGPAVLIWNRKSFNRMTTEQKKIHLKWMSYVTASEAIGEFVIDNQQILAQLMKTKDVRLVPSDTKGFMETANRYDAVQRTRNIETARKFGVQDPEAILDAYAKARDKWAHLSQKIGRNINKFAAAIQHEIYDKVDLSKL